MKDPTWPTARELYGLAKAHKWDDFLAAYQAMKKRVRTAASRRSGSTRWPASFGGRSTHKRASVGATRERDPRRSRVCIPDRRERRSSACGPAAARSAASARDHERRPCDGRAIVSSTRSWQVMAGR
jgi:hypothetical protein